MYFPFISQRSVASDATRTRRRRRSERVDLESKRGGHHGDDSGHRIGHNDIHHTPGVCGKCGPIIVNTGTGSHHASTSGYGGGPVVTIPKGQPFAGRSEGGATRDEIFGSSDYGSGYPGISKRGTSGRGFPFYFWPVVWGTGPSYLHPSEYGSLDNNTRPGGQLMTAAFTVDGGNQTIRVLSDNATVSIIVDEITVACSTFLPYSPPSITPSRYNQLSEPKPEQAIQYFRASSLVITLDGYNNTAAFSEKDDAQDVPLPSDTNLNFLYCVNSTIGGYAPLVQVSSNSSSTAASVPTGASSVPTKSPNSSDLMWSSPSGTGLVTLAWLLWVLSAMT